VKKKLRDVRRKRAKHQSGANATPQTNQMLLTPSSADCDQIVRVSEELGEFVPYDENLLERAHIQWQFGDWESLAKLERNTLQHHPDRAKLALLAAAGNMQLGDTNAARQFTRLAQDWGCSKKLVSQVLIAGVHNTLGRAAAVSGQQPRALKHFESAIAIGTPGSDVRLITRARLDKQLAQFGLSQTHELVAQTLMPPYKLVKSTAFFGNVDGLIEQALQLAPEDPALLIAYAETAMRQGLYDEAIRRWQHLSAVLGEDMLQPYYERLEEAYLNLKSFPIGTPEEESLRGDRDKHELLADIHQKLLPDFYLEIGVQTGKSLMLAKCRALGIDPMPLLKFPLNNQTSVIKATSDDFFAKQADAILKQPPDLVFIDGMHLFEYVLRDFIHVERYASASTLVVIDDIYPGHPAQAERDRRTRAWTGDVWKLLAVLEEYRPDLFLQTLDAHPTGLLMVTGLNPVNQVLSQRYDEIVARYADIDTLPNAFLARKGAWSCSDIRVDRVIEKIRLAKQILQKRESLINDLRVLTAGGRVNSL
jgi:tetratricopeptide (TPR) repeat protein